MRPRALYVPLFAVLASSGRFQSLVLSDSLGLPAPDVGWVLGSSVLAGALGLPVWTSRAGQVGCVRVLREQVGASMVLGAGLAVGVALADVQARFAWALFLRALGAWVMNPAGAVMDALALQSIGDRDRYGEERLFGAVSWGVVNLGAGVVMDLGEGAMMPLVVSLVLLMAGSVVLLVLLHMWDAQAARVQAEEDATAATGRGGDGAVALVDDGANRGETSGRASDQDDDEAGEEQQDVPLTMFGFWRRHSSARLSVFLVTAWIMGGATSLVENLMFLFLRNDLKASYTVCGLSVLITVSFEIPIFAYGKKLLDVVGTTRLILGGMLAYVVRVLVYTLADTPWVILVVEPLHGVTYAFIQTSFVAYMTRLSPSKANLATGQGLLNFARDLGRLVGTVAGGYILDTLGASVMYRGAAAVVSVNLLVVWWVLRDPSSPSSLPASLPLPASTVELELGEMEMRGSGSGSGSGGAGGAEVARV